MSTLLAGARQIVTCRGPVRARRGPEMAQLDVVEDGAVLIDDHGTIAAVGPYKQVRDQSAGATVVEVTGVLFPGFVDAHTHAVFGAPRLADHERRALGMDYKAIAAEGGGINSSVRDFREHGTDALEDLTRRRLARLLAEGTTTVEVKSGYGLTTKDELRALDVARRVSGVPSVIPTFLGAHEVPPEFRDEREAYIDLLLNEMLPAVAEQGIARFCDVFCEPGVFSVDESRKILRAAQGHGLGLKLHADELDGSGGAELAGALQATSADHLAQISEHGIHALAQSGTVAVLLPGTMLFLGKAKQAPARRLIEAGCAVALATDFNPGSSPGMSLPLMGTLGVSQMGMRPAEAIVAITVNGAAAVGEAGTRGQIAPGFRADLALAAISDWRELVYWYGTTLVRDVWVSGSPCHPREAPVNLLA